MDQRIERHCAEAKARLRIACPAFGWLRMSSQPVSLAILYADICDSVRLYERIGGTEAHRLVEASMGHMVSITKRLGGTVIRTQGDGRETSEYTIEPS